jgi:hypothetical protein
MNPDRYPAIISALRSLVRYAYSEGFGEGINDVNRQSGGKSWSDYPSVRKKLELIERELG